MLAWSQVASYRSATCMVSDSIAGYRESGEARRMLCVWRQEASIRHRALRITAKAERRLLTAGVRALAANRASCHNTRRACHHRDCSLLESALQQWLIHTRSMHLWNAAVSHFNDRCACLLLCSHVFGVASWLAQAHTTASAGYVLRLVLHCNPTACDSTTTVGHLRVLQL